MRPCRFVELNSHQGEYYWFELVQMAKKMILTGALILIESENSLYNILVGIFCCLFYIIILTNYKPYLEDDDDRLGESVCLWLFISFRLD